MFRLQLVSRLIPDSTRKLGLFVLAAFGLLALSPTADAFDIVQITNNILDDTRPAISGSSVVWESYQGSDIEIFLWNGVTITNISNRPGSSSQTWDVDPDISGSNVVWQGHDGNDSEIYFWDGFTITNISNNGFDDSYPAISGSNVVWSGRDWAIGGDSEIYLWNGATITQLTNNSTTDSSPAISGSNVVWTNTEGGFEIYFWDGATVTQITNSADGADLAISGSNVVWRESGIALWDGFTITQLTDNSTSDAYPDISGANVVWQGIDDGDYDIYMTAITEPVPSISFGGFALLGGLVFAIAAGGLAVKRGRGAL